MKRDSRIKPSVVRREKILEGRRDFSYRHLFLEFCALLFLRFVYPSANFRRIADGVFFLQF